MLTFDDRSELKMSYIHISMMMLLAMVASVAVLVNGQNVQAPVIVDDTNTYPGRASRQGCYGFNHLNNIQIIIMKIIMHTKSMFTNSTMFVVCRLTSRIQRHLRTRCEQHAVCSVHKQTDSACGQFVQSFLFRKYAFCTYSYIQNVNFAIIGPL